MPFTRTALRHSIKFFALLSLLSGCAAVGPIYQFPPPPVAEQWQAALPHNGATLNLLAWWDRFNDPVLSKLLRASENNNPDLDLAIARLNEARASLVVTHTGQQPSITGSGMVQRSGIKNDTTTPTQWQQGLNLDASWELDLFGSVRRANEAAAARLEGRTHAWHGARVSLAAEVANKYLTYRACRQVTDAYERDVNSRQETAKITAVAAKAGLSTPADAQLAQASWADTTSQWLALQATCDIIVKSLVTLTGLPETELRQELQSGLNKIPSAPPFAVPTLPVALLSQRPDLAASERELAAASADIGLAEANRYPRLFLLGNLSVSAVQTATTDLHMIPWSLGPSLTLPLLNGGSQTAKVDEAQARYQQALARYRKAIQTAVEEVETALVNLDSAARRTTMAHVATQGYAAYLLSAKTNWRAGSLSQLALEEARRAASQAERAEIILQRDLALYWVALYKALGGGWEKDTVSLENSHE
ncbi:MAG: efflux transporter outer membrane subunit [Magnetococcus sp. DMHC-6]